MALTLPEVRSFQRHGSVAMTERYAHLAPGHLHDRIATAVTPRHAQSSVTQTADDPAPSSPPRLVAAVAPMSPEEGAAGVGNLAHAGHQNLAHAEEATLTKPLVSRARPPRLELGTYGLEGHRSIQLSYGRRVCLVRRDALWGNESKSGRRDLNPRHPAPKAGALPGCATPRLNAANFGGFYITFCDTVGLCRRISLRKRDKRRRGGYTQRPV